MPGPDLSGFRRAVQLRNRCRDAAVAAGRRLGLPVSPVQANVAFDAMVDLIRDHDQVRWDDAEVPRDLTVRVFSVADDGLPDMDALTGRVAFIFNGCLVSGWPLRDNRYYPPRWEADSDVGRVTEFEGVTHWVELPVPVREIEKPSTYDT